MRNTKKNSKFHVFFSGMFPLFKPGAVNLGGAYLRAHVTAKPQFGKTDQVSEVSNRSDSVL